MLRQKLKKDHLCAWTRPSLSQLVGGGILPFVLQCLFHREMHVLCVGGRTAVSLGPGDARTDDEPGKLRRVRSLFHG